MGTYKKEMLESFRFPLRLDRLACIRIGAKLFETNKWKTQVEAFYKSNVDERIRSKSFEKMVAQTIKELDQLELPENLKETLNYVSRFMGISIYNWTEFLAKNLYKKGQGLIYGRDVKLAWTYYGEIDRIESFKLILSSKKRQVNIWKLFNVACNLCIENYIPALWKKVPKRQKDNFYTYKVFQDSSHHLIAYWVCKLKKNVSGIVYLLNEYQIYDLNACMCRIAVEHGNSDAVKHFWYGIAIDLKETYSIFCDTEVSAMALTGQYAKIVCFFLGRMNADTLCKLAKSEKRFERVVEMLVLNPPWHEFIQPLLNCLWGVIDVDQYMQTLFFIAYAATKSQELAQFSRYLLRAIWLNTPQCYKNNESLSRLGIIATLLEGEDFESAKLIVREMDSRQIFSFGMIQFCNLVRNGRFDILSRYESEILLSIEERAEFRAVLKENASIIYGDLHRLEKKGLAKEFLHWLYGDQTPDWIVHYQ